MDTKTPVQLDKLPLEKRRIYIAERIAELKREIERSDKRSLASLATPLGLSDYNGQEKKTSIVNLRNLYTLTDDAWEKFGAELRALLAGGANWPNLQLVGVPSPVNWDDPRFGAYYRNKFISDLVNQQGGGFQKSSTSFSDLYDKFITNIYLHPIDPAMAAQAASDLAALGAAKDACFQKEQDFKFAWAIFDRKQRNDLPSSDWLTAEQWYSPNPVGTGASETLDQYTQMTFLAWAQWKASYQAAFGGGESAFDIISKFSPDKQLRVMEPNTDGSGDGAAGQTNVWPYTMTPDYQQWITDARAGTLQTVTLNVSSQSGSYDYTHTGIAGGVGIFFGFFGVAGVAGRETTTIDTTSADFSLTLSGVFQTFDITPGDWYDSTAFSLYRDGPFASGSPIEALYNAGHLFGPNGFINFRPARAIVVYKPVVKVKLASQDYHYFKQVTSGAAGFFIGPFAVGVAEYYNVQQSVQWNDSSLELTLFNAPETPHLLAFDSEYMSPWI
jgi:hypothetical protein